MVLFFSEYKNAPYSIARDSSAFISLIFKIFPSTRYISPPKNAYDLEKLTYFIYMKLAIPA